MPLTRITSNVIENGTIIDADIAANAAISTSKLQSYSVSAKTIYLSPRTDGIAGTGTILDPYDASTPLKFETLMNSFPAYSNIVLLKGTYRTRGTYSNVVNGGFSLKSGWNISGEGIDKTIVILDFEGNLPSWIRTSVFGHAESSNIFFDDVTIKDMTIDANYLNNGSDARSLVCAAWNGENALIENVKGLNTSGWQDGSTTPSGAVVSQPIEGFSFFLSSPSSKECKNLNIRNCILEDVRGDYCNGFVIASFLDPVGSLPVRLAIGSIDSCFVKDNPNWASFFAQTITNCTSINCGFGIRWDTGPIDGSLWSNNKFLRCTQYPIALYSSGNDSIAYPNTIPTKDILISGNYLEWTDPIRWGIGLQEVQPPPAGSGPGREVQNLIITNNIFKGPSYFIIVDNNKYSGHCFNNQILTPTLVANKTVQVPFTENNKFTIDLSSSSTKEKGQSREIWISKRSDKSIGTGTQNDPLNGTNADNVAFLFNNFLQNTDAIIHFGKGTFEVNWLPFWGLKSGGKYVLTGEGFDQTTLKLSNNTCAIGETRQVISLDGSTALESVEICNMTIDCNRQNQPAFTSNNGRVGAIDLTAKDAYIHDLRVINSFSSTGSGSIRLLHDVVGGKGIYKIENVDIVDHVSAAGTDSSAIAITNLTTPNNVTGFIKNCKITGTNYWGLDIWQVNNFSIESNTILNAHSPIALRENCQYLTISNNILTYPNKANNAGISFINAASSKITIDANIFTGLDVSAAHIASTAAALKTVVSNNTFESGAGFYLFGGSTGVFSGNIIPVGQSAPAGFTASGNANL